MANLKKDATNLKDEEKVKTEIFDDDFIPSAGHVCGYEGNKSKLRKEHQLILIKVRFMGKTIIALVDSGATHNAISQAFIKKYNFKINPSLITKIKLANGKIVDTSGEITGRIYMNNFNMNTKHVIMPMDGEEFEMILGKEWLAQVNPDIDWKTNTITINDTIIHGIDDNSIKPIRICSFQTTYKAARRRGSRAWTILIHPKVPEEENTAKCNNTSNLGNNENKAQPYSKSLVPPDWEKVKEELKDWPELLTVLLNHKDVFEPLPDGTPPKERVTHKIELKEGANPPFRRPYRMSPKELDELKKQIQGLLDKGWIRPSHSPFGSPVLFVAKADGSLRLCVDYRALNAVTKRSRYPIPRTDELFDRLNKACYLTCLDFQQGYHQVAIDEADVEKTAFVTRYGQYEWLVMPFGLCNAPSTFQAMMNQLLGNDVDDIAMAYLDDLTIFSENKDLHVKHVEKILQKLQDAGYKCRMSKCKFGRKEVELLGFIVGNGKIRPSPKKTEVVRNWKVPENVHDLMVFLGFTNFYRRFVYHYSQIAAPLTDLLKKKNKWIWTDKEQDAFDTLKDKLTNAPALLLPNWDLPFYVVCDASDFALGATLMQDQGNGLQPVAYEGRKMTESEVNYVTTDKENLALVHALRTWRCYLEGRKCTIETDHEALKALLNKEDPSNKRRNRWIELLANFEMDIIHKPGKQNKSDPLSRQNYPKPKPDQIAIAYTLNMKTLDNKFLEECREGYKASNYYEQLQNKNLKSMNLRKEDNLWYKGNKLCLPPGNDTLITVILQELHDQPSGGHFGFEKTFKNVSQRFYWPSMWSDIKLYVKTCPTCQRAKHVTKRPAGLLQPLPVPNYPWEQVTMDLLLDLPLTSSGHNAAVVFVDRLTKMVRWEPCNINVTAEGVAKIYLQTIIRNHGVPRSLISDRDTRFISGFWQELQRLLGTHVKMSTTGHPQTDGQTENANKTLLQILRCYAGKNPRNWDELLAIAELAYNSQKQASTGKSPFYCNHGREPEMPLDLILPAERCNVEQLIKNIHAALASIKEQLTVSQQKQKKAADVKRRQVNYHEGDKVLVSSSIFRMKQPDYYKVMPAYMGPFKVTSVKSPVNVQLQLPDQLKTYNVFHVSKLKPFFETTRFGNRGQDPPYDMIAGHPEFEVEAILAKKVVRSYLVKWVGLDHCEDMWIKNKYLNNARDIVQEYEDSHR
jgi:hypothetical protein